MDLGKLALKSAALLSTLVLVSAASNVQAQEQLPWKPGSTRAGAAEPMTVGANDAYRADRYEQRPAPSGDTYPSPADDQAVDEYGGQETGPAPSDQRAPGDQGGSDQQGYGEPYSPPPQTYEDATRGGGDPSADPRRTEGFEQSEILGAGHRFFGSISGGIANGIEWAFKSQGRPNGYILGEDAGGAFILGLRYGEGRLFTKDAGEHPVFWQGPTLGYDAGGDGSKTMVLVYNMRDPSEIYERFGGVQGAAYLVGGVSVQIQKYNDVTLAVIRSGVGLRLGANVGYMKYTRSPTWNPL